MPIVTTPATTLLVPTWTYLTIGRSLAIIPPSGGTAGSLLPSWTVSLAKGTVEYLGDANGNPVQPLVPGALSQGNNMTTVVLDLSEVVTRADGVTKLSVLALLDALAMAQTN